MDVLREAARSAGSVCCTIVETRGSVPAGVGARMLVRADGTFAGTVGGGCLEHDVWAAARRTFDDGAARCISVDLTDYEALEQGLACGGSLRVLLEPVDVGLAARLGQALVDADAGKPVVLWSRLPAAAQGEPAAGYVDGLHPYGPCGPSLGGPLVAAAAEAADAARTGIVTLGDARVFLQPLVAPELVIFGGGHVGLAIARAAAPCGWRIAVVDDREKFANPMRFSGARTVVSEFPEAFARLEIRPSTAILCVTRGHRFDEVVLDGAVRTPARYVGLIGSARKILGIYKRLLGKGIAADALARVFAPIGVGIGAETPEEIAAAVIAELIAFRRLGPEGALALNPKAAEVRARLLDMAKPHVEPARQPQPRA